MSLEKTSKVFAIILITGLYFTPIELHSHSGATGIVKERMDAMKDIASQLKAVKALLDSNKQLDHATIREAGIKIRNLANEIQHQFPEGSTNHPSEASPLIWKEWEKFLELAQSLATAADELSASSQASKTNSEIKTAFGKIAATCLSCHKSYRIKR